MENSNKTPDARKPRLWPGIVILILVLVLRYLLPVIDPALYVTAFLCGIGGGILMLLWWLFFSRVAWTDRLSAVFLIVLALFLTSHLVHESIARANMGMMFWLFSIPVITIAFILWALLTRHLSLKIKRITMIATIVVASGFWLCLRTNGMNGSGGQYFDWRWSQTSEEKLLSKSGNEASGVAISSNPGVVAASWSGFRGALRDGIAHDTKINPASKPSELWHKPVGPGCSSFAVSGGFFFTQEQRGDNEDVSCYDLKTGSLVWLHSDKARFYEPHAGAGPRATPTLEGNLIYTLGATGILNVLEAKTGKVIWTRNVAAETGEKLPGWGYCGSPIISGNKVIVAVSGRLAAYDTLSGKPEWTGPDGGESYSSPQLFTVAGVPQVLLMSDSGVLSVSPADGKKLWDFPWKIEGRILQPAMISEGEFLISGENKSLKRILITHENDKWNVKELWESPGIMIYFNDFVLHKGYAYGYDGPTMVCVDLRDGKKIWRGNRYRGFQVLLPDQDLIVILTEKGEIAIVRADPSKFTELHRLQAINGRTWNHPALAGDILLVRNDHEMAAYRL